MRVYRIAKELKGMEFPIGPYHYWNHMDEESPEWYERMCDAHSCDDYHVTPIMDGHAMMSYEYSVFTSEISLMEWFEGYLEDMGDYGFRVWVYDALDWGVTVLTNQAVASKYVLTLVNSYPLNPEK